jgi:hypothetical protein
VIAYRRTWIVIETLVLPAIERGRSVEEKSADGVDEMGNNVIIKMNEPDDSRVIIQCRVGASRVRPQESTTLQALPKTNP